MDLELESGRIIRGATEASLGVKVPEGSFVFRCCGEGELTIEDEVAALKSA
jgi:hypothetical protein